MGKKKATTRVRKKKDATVEDDGETNDGGKDTLLTPVEKQVRQVIAWVTKTNSAPGGLGDWFVKNVEKVEPERKECVEFLAQKPKNRFTDIICIDATRVKLKEVEPGKDYIHANYIKMPPSSRTYIATQMPLEGTVEDFWRMVFYENVDTVINLSSADDQGVVEYFPKEMGKFATYGKFFVNNRKVTPPAARYTPTQHQIEVLPDGCSNSRIITLLHYPYWSKNQVPAHPLVIMKLLRLVKVDKSTNGPVVVHCSSGINRSACVILSDIIIDLTFRNIDPDIANLAKKLRNQRAQFIQQKQSFIYAIYVFLDYVKLRCKRFNVFPDMLKEIEGLQSSLSKEFTSITAKEPASAAQSKRAKENVSVDDG